MAKAKTYAVFGLGRYGIAVAKELVKSGAEVLAVDMDEEIVNEAVTEIPICKCADVTDSEVLKQLGISDIEEGGVYRNRLLQTLEDIGIATRQGTHALHLLGYYKNRFGFKPTDYENAYACDRLSITLPLYVGLTEADQKYVVASIRKVLDEQGK